MKGSEAIAEAAIRAGARYFFGYPITPQTEIPEYMSARMPEVGGCFLQAESEVAAINMIYGAAGAGARALTSSSSPGVSLKQEGISRFTASVELNGRELKDCGLLGGMLSIYGYQPVMITANCIQKNTRSCERKPSLLYLTDRYQNRFPVRNECSFCYNIIYNPVPLMLMKQHKEIRNLQPSALRLDFTMESGKETRDIINVYGDVFLRGRNAQLPEASYTKGHFKRGVK